MSGISKTIANRTQPKKADIHVAGVVLAGGRSRRFKGAEKALQILAGRSLIQRVIGRARPQVDNLVISTNGDPSRFPKYANSVVVIDDMEGYQGPLAGLAACISWLTKDRPKTRWVATFPVDSPFFPKNLVASLCAEALTKGVPAFVVSGGRVHPVFGLWPVSIEPELRRYLVKRKRSSMADFIRSQDGIEVVLATSSPDPFFNINTEEDLILAEYICRELGCGD